MMVLVPILAAAVAPAAECRTMRVARPAGAVVSESDSVAGPCAVDAVPAKLRYDIRRGVSVARVDLVEGEPLGRVYLQSRPEVLPGDPVQLVVRIGNVVLRREVRALQAARLRQRFFARGAEGHVLRAPPFVGEVLP